VAKSAPDTSTILNLAPTMLIGIGGTGKDVLLRIRRLFYERGGKKDNIIGYPIIGYLVLDTDRDAFTRLADESVSAFVTQEIQFNRGGLREAVYCSVLPNEFTQYMTGGKRVYPHVFDWLLPEVGQYGASGVTEGAGQNRQLGRLAFFHNFREIKRCLEAGIQEIIEHAKAPQKVARWLPPNAIIDETRLEVVLVYSLAGGTGAGMFLDMGMLARKVVNDLKLGVRPHFTHIGVLPEPFVQDARPSAKAIVDPRRMREKIQENAFACLREMEYFSLRRREADFGLSIPPPVSPPGADGAPQQPLYTVCWERDGEEHREYDPPWDTCYLIGGRSDAMGPSCLLPSEIYQMIAEYIFLDFDPSDFGAQKRSLRVNLFHELLDNVGDVVRDERGGQLYQRKLSRRYSTFGLSQIYFDRERMRRAASHRLAGRLVREWWLRPSPAGPAELVRLAQEDLVGGEGRVLTNTQRDGDKRLALSYEGIFQQIMLKEGGSNRTWWNDVRDEAARLASEIEDGAHDPMAADPLTAWQAEHEDRLQRSKAAAGETGMALRSYEAQGRRLRPEIDDRLNALFHYRLQELGVPGTRHLLREYAQITDKQVHQADKLETVTPRAPTGWKQRLKEARRLPLYARKTAGWELYRGVNEVRRYLTDTYHHRAVPEIRKCLQAVQRRLSPNTQKGSYADVLHRFELALEGETGGVLGYLEGRYTELKSNNLTRARTIGLMARWDDDRYDEEIHDLIEPDSPKDTPLDWEQIERDVLGHLRQQDRRWKDVQSLGDLVLHLVDLENPQVIESEFEELARSLAEACESLLGTFAAGTSALLEFSIEKANERQQTLRQMRTYASPCLSHTNVLDPTGELEVPVRVCLGIANSDTSEEARRFVEELQATNVPGADPLHNLGTFSIKDDAIVLYQEKAGIALASYADLTDLGRLYDASSRIPETHIDYRAMKDRLPEIRLVDQERQQTLAESLENVFYGIMTGVLAYDEQNRIFRMAMSQSGGGQLIYPLGNRLEEITNLCATNRGVLDDLTRQVGKWLDDAVANVYPLLGLWCAIQQLNEEVRRRVQHLIDRGVAKIDRDSAGRDPHPLMTILGRRMMPHVLDRIGKLEDADHYLRSSLNWNLVAERIKFLPSEQAKTEIWIKWKKQLDGCLKVIDEVSLPIPVVLMTIRLTPAEANGDPLVAEQPSKYLPY
jgi:Tubulin like